MKKNNVKKQQIITISIFSVIIVIILVFFLFYLGRSEIDDDVSKETEKETQQPVLIPIEFLSEDELIDLGVNPNTRAQVISRDPLIYKVIEDDKDIIEDIAPYLEPIRE